MIEYDNYEISEAIDRWVHSQRDRAILKRRFIDGVVFERIAEEFDLSTVQVKRIVYREGDKVFMHLK